MEKLFEFFDFSYMSGRAKIILGLVLLMVLALVAFGVWWFVLRDEMVEQPVLMQVLTGEVEYYRGSKATTVSSGDDIVSLQEGNRIIAKPGALAVIRYFDGSAVKIEGQTEVELSLTRGSGEEQLPKVSRAISLLLQKGKITAGVVALKEMGSRSFFEIVTPNSVGVVDGTIFEVEVNELRETYWEVGGGIVNVAAVAVGSDMLPVVALIPLNAGDAIAVPALPIEWRDDRSTAESMLAAATGIARESVWQASSDVTVKGTSLLGLNEETGTSVFNLDIDIALASAVITISEIKPGYTVVIDQLLAQFAPGLEVTKAPLVKRMFVPILLTPEGADPLALPVIRGKPPTYLFSIFDLDEPAGIAVDPVRNRVYVIESGGSRVTRVLDGEGNRIMALYPPDSVTLERNPIYVAVDWLGTVYVSDRRRHAIDMYDANGSYLGIFTPLDDPHIVWSPLGLAFDAAGNFYITELTSLKHRVMVLDSSDKLVLEFGTEGRKGGEFAYPNGAVADSSGRIFVADSNNFRIQVFDAQGELIGVDKTTGFMRGMALEGNYLYVVDTFAHLVRVFNITEGMNQVFTFGQLGVGDGEFNFPNSLAFDGTGRLYITDRENNRIQVWSYEENSE